MMQKRTFIKEMTLLSVTLILVFACAEVLLKIYLPQPILPLVYKEDPLFGYKLKEGFNGFQSSSEFKVSLSFNSKGLRDYEHNIVKDSGILRILVLGDSFALGDGVEMTATYPKVLEQMLNSRYGKKYEVINSGVYGWDLTREYLYLVTEGLNYHPDRIIWGIFVGNDFYDTLKVGLPINGMNLGLKKNVDYSINTKTILERIPGYPFLCQYSQVFNLFKRGCSILLSYNKEKEFIDFTNSLYSKEPSEDVKASFRLIEMIVKKGYLASKDKGIEFYVVLIPAYEQVYTKDAVLMVHGLDLASPSKRLAKFLDDNRIPFVDLLPEMRKYSDGGKDLYYKKNKHWNEYGHMLAAQAIVESLKDDK